MAANISPSSTTVYHPSFTDPTADTVLRSAEGTLFRVPAFVLRRTTAYFTATLPSSTPSADPIPLDTPAALLVYVLSILCGLPPPRDAPPLDFDTAEAVLDLAERWTAPGLSSRMRDAITNPVFLAEPLRLYVVAVRAGWRDEASLAARGTLVLGLYDDVHTELLRRLPTLDLMVLLGLHRRRRDLLDQMLSGRWEDAEGQSFGLGKKVVGGTCAACGYVTDNHVWREYRARIFLEMDRRALGDTVLGSAVDDWSEAQACWRAKCAREGCDKLLWDRDTIMPQLKACIDRLPDAI